jgi:peptidoglycan/LPS O-acetylase OafA/YrhL
VGQDERMMRGTLRNSRIDLMRGVSILLVLFHHFNIAYHLSDTSLATMPGWNAVRAIARNGNYGVTMFFVISGFLITSNAKRRWSALNRVDCRAFYALRFVRVAPAARRFQWREMAPSRRFLFTVRHIERGFGAVLFGAAESQDPQRVAA